MLSKMLSKTRRLYTYGLTLRAFRLCHVSTKVLVMAAFVFAKLRPNFTAFCPTDCADNRRTSVMLSRRSSHTNCFLSDRVRLDRTGKGRRAGYDTTDRTTATGVRKGLRVEIVPAARRTNATPTRGPDGIAWTSGSDIVSLLSGQEREGEGVGGAECRPFSPFSAHTVRAVHRVHARSSVDGRGGRLG